MASGCGIGVGTVVVLLLMMIIVGMEVVVWRWTCIRVCSAGGAYGCVREVHGVFFVGVVSRPIGRVELMIVALVVLVVMIVMVVLDVVVVVVVAVHNYKVYDAMCLVKIASIKFYISEINCTNPRELSNSSVAFTLTTFGHTANYTCATGFRFPSGDRMAGVSCSDTGNWTTPNGTCEGEFLSPSAHSHSHTQVRTHYIYIYIYIYILAGYPASLGTLPLSPPSHSSLPPSDYPASVRLFAVSSLKITPFSRYFLKVDA